MLCVVSRDPRLRALIQFEVTRTNLHVPVPMLVHCCDTLGVAWEGKGVDAAYLAYDTTTHVVDDACVELLRTFWRLNPQLKVLVILADRIDRPQTDRLMRLGRLAPCDDALRTLAVSDALGPTLWSDLVLGNPGTRVVEALRTQLEREIVRRALPNGALLMAVAAHAAKSGNVTDFVQAALATTDARVLAATQHKWNRQLRDGDQPQLKQVLMAMRVGVYLHLRDQGFPARRTAHFLGESGTDTLSRSFRTTTKVRLADLRAISGPHVLEHVVQFVTPDRSCASSERLKAWANALVRRGPGPGPGGLTASGGTLRGSEVNDPEDRGVIPRTIDDTSARAARPRGERRLA